MLNKGVIANILLVLGVAFLVSGVFLLSFKGEPELEARAGINRSPEDFSLEYHELIKESPKEIQVTIPKGSTAFMVANILEEKGLLPADEFIGLLILFDFEARLKAGEYSFSSEANVADILEEILIKRR